MNRLFHNKTGDEHMGLEISDLMMALVAIFLLGSVLMQNRADEYRDTRTHNQRYLDELIQKEFQSLQNEEWLEIHPGGILRYQGNFKNNQSDITESLAAELDSFCSILKQFVIDHTDLVDVIFFEGHTTQSWKDPKNTPYYGNKSVSEARAVKTMRYCLGERFEYDYPELMSKFIAIGYSYTKPIYKKDGKVNKKATKRVDIRLVESRSINELH